MDGDHRVSRREFETAVPTLKLLNRKGEPFSLEAITDFFTMLDKDASGNIDYRELQHELRPDAHKQGTRRPSHP